ncbi:HlyD family efflux transporter periplasmic adaptor subunit [Mastigocoleus sp. MO_188.B34]|uniref:efflux RND transporter periplasmic adaptor subunit n=1 Tax=Mastigocoleus sp. MO_188.B34 TaxID=3036635 RepID=UPI002607310A|nr:HlyD family efflux transporter periplasmic adaptor subunit [Mastigocoleus sp. MO_188.B34]MDJ0695482.1 HlyD family efflux transporter periplasmic adaptor subunit [Mastigocoleus sp. MO_188.B34]
MTTEQHESIEKVSESVDNVDTSKFVGKVNVSQFKKNITGQSKWLLLLGAIFIFAGGITLWRSVSSFQKPSEEIKNNLNQGRLTVRTVPVKVGSIQAWVYGDATVNAITKKHLTFQAEGTIDYIKKVKGRDLREGDRVKKGQLLARVDRRKHDANITVAAAGHIEAKNQVRDAVASLKQAEESLAQAKAELQKAITDKNFAQVDLKRYQELVAEGAVEKRELDLKETNYKNAQAGEITAEAGVRSAEAQLAAAKTRVDTAEAGVKSANAKLTQSNVQSEDTEIVAPFDGIISRLNIREGDYWTPQRVNAGAEYQSIIERLPIIVIDPNRFEVNVELPAFQGARVKRRQRAFIILDRDRSKANSGRITGEDLMKLASAQGTVFSVSPSVSPGERSVRVTIRINQGIANIQDGEQVSAWIATEEKSRATIAPFNAFVFRDRKPYGFVVNEEKGTVEQREIKAGIEGLAKQEILEGVKPGEKLVTDGKNRLVNGAPVEIIP